MKRYEGIVLLSDVDGTLIDENNRISQENIEAIEYFRAHGGKFTLATGRVPPALMPILAGITLDFPCICHNGCSIYDIEKQAYVHTIPLSKMAKKAAEEIMRNFPESGVEIMTTEGIYVVKQTAATDHHITFEEIEGFYGETFDTVNVPWLKILFAQGDEETTKISERMKDSKWNDSFSLIRTHRYYYEIFHKEASKGAALLNLCSLYGVDIKNVAAIGDNENDISMLKLSAVSAATGNASDFVKQYADMVTRRNDESAVADFISKL